MFYVKESDKPIEEGVKTLPEVVKRHRFGVLGTHDLRRKMNEKGVPVDRECCVGEICNPHQAKKVLDEDMGVSTVLSYRAAMSVSSVSVITNALRLHRVEL